MKKWIKIGTKENGEPFELDVQEHLIDSGLAIIGKRKSGKSYAIGKICELLAEIGQPFIIIDVMGQYYTLKKEYPVVVVSMGQEPYADLKNITPDVSENLAKAILETGQSVVIDLSYGSMLEQYKFMAKFFRAFYETAKKVARPVVLVIDEIHRITPEKSMIKLPDISKLQNEVTYWVAEIARTGRKHGIGYIVAGQREAETAKTSLTQCEIQINFKVVGIDYDNLKRKIPSELAERVKKLRVGEAVVLGFDDVFVVKIDERKTPHGGTTPEFQPVKVDLTKFTELMKETQTRDVREDTRVQLKMVKAERDELKERVKQLESTVENLKKELSSAKLKKDSIHELEKELEMYKKKVKEYEEELSRASELEKEIENMREAAKAVFEALLEFSDVAGFELVPSDILEWKRRAEELEEKLKIYEMTEKEKKLRVKETLEDRAVKSWIGDAKRFLRHLLSRGGVFPNVLKQVIRYDPETLIRPEDIDVGVTVDTVRKYLKELASKGLLIECEHGKKYFKNSFSLWVAQNVRKIKPYAPDDAIDAIVQMLMEYIYSNF